MEGLKVIALLGYRIVEAKVSVAKSGTLYVLCPNWDATTTKLKILGLSRPFWDSCQLWFCLIGTGYYINTLQHSPISQCICHDRHMALNTSQHRSIAQYILHHWQKASRTLYSIYTLQTVHCTHSINSRLTDCYLVGRQSTPHSFQLVQTLHPAENLHTNQSHTQ